MSIVTAHCSIIHGMQDQTTDRIVGPGFHAKVYARVRLVPLGKVTTYGDVATALGSPRVARHVGWALAALAGKDTDVPWHRVINAKGQISFKGQIHRATLQRQHLEHEGVIFDKSGTVDMKKYRWYE